MKPLEYAACGFVWIVGALCIGTGFPLAGLVLVGGGLLMLGYGLACLLAGLVDTDEK